MGIVLGFLASITIISVTDDICDYLKEKNKKEHDIK